jgi:hypothetical protein
MILNFEFFFCLIKVPSGQIRAPGALCWLPSFGVHTLPQHGSLVDSWVSPWAYIGGAECGGSQCIGGAAGNNVMACICIASE